MIIYDWSILLDRNFLQIDLNLGSRKYLDLRDKRSENLFIVCACISYLLTLLGVVQKIPSFSSLI